MGVESPSVPVVIEESGPMGMAQLSAALIREAVSSSPALARRIRGLLELVVTDYKIAVTVRFEGSRVAIGGAADGEAWVVVEGGALLLVRFGSRGNTLGPLLRRDVRMRGALRHPVFALRLWRLLAKAEVEEPS